MDLSKLSTDDLLALKSGDLSKVSTEGLLRLKGQTVPAKEGPTLDTGLRAMTASMNPNPPMIIPKEAEVPLTTGDEAGQKFSESIAEAIGSTGHPILGGLVAGAVRTMPDMLKAGVALAGAPTIANELKTLANPSKLMNAAEKKAGVVLRSPVTKQMARDLGLPKGQQSFGEVTNAVKASLDEGKKIPLQTAKDFLLKGDTVLKSPMGGGEKAALSQTMAKVRDYLNSEIPGRSAPANAFRTVSNLKNAGAKLAKYGAVGSALVGGGAALNFALKKLAGG